MATVIHKWTDLQKERSWDSLLLGNGASIALDRSFSYSSLYQVALAQGFLGPSQQVFRGLATDDFEHVMLAMWYADIVNTALAAGSTTISTAYADVRDGLIKSVHHVHCLPASVTPAFPHLANFSKQFKTIVTFNYDLTLYWTMMNANTFLGNWFKDCFVGLHQTFDPTWRRLRHPYNATGTTLVFYGHGSLLLGRDRLGLEAKIVTHPSGQAGWATQLLTEITHQWTQGQVAPVFVSEGHASDKLRSIRRSGYLSTVYDQVLTDLEDAVVVYGLSFAPNDEHILEAMKTKPPKEIAVSVYTRLPPNEQQAFCLRVQGAIVAKLGHGTNVRFFDHASSACWNNP